MARRKKVLCVVLPSAGLDELTRMLKDAAFTVVTAHSFASALQWLHREAPDAILLDEKLSIVDGLWSVDILKKILPNAVLILVGANQPNLPAVVQLLNDKLGSRQVNGAGASGS